MLKKPIMVLYESEKKGLRNKVFSNIYNPISANAFVQYQRYYAGSFTAWRANKRHLPLDFCQTVIIANFTVPG